MTVIFDYLRSVSREKETLAERFSRLTEEAGLLPAEVGRIMGLGEGMVYKIKRGDVKTPGLIGMLRLARRLGVSPYYLACEPDLSEVDPARIDQIESNVNHLGIRDKLRGPLPGEGQLVDRLSKEGDDLDGSPDILSIVSDRLRQQNSAIARVLRAAFRVIDLHDPNVEEALGALEETRKAQ
jgi:transcriptional regulator with XRE-family HTH domain